MTKEHLYGLSGIPATENLEPGMTRSAGAMPGEDGFDPLNTVIGEIEVLGNASLHHGARLLIMRELLRALCRNAPAGLQADIASSLRAGTERILARTDERPLPDAFYHALLDEMNRYLECL